MLEDLRATLQNEEFRENERIKSIQEEENRQR